MPLKYAYVNLFFVVLRLIRNISVLTYNGRTGFLMSFKRKTMDSWWMAERVAPLRAVRAARVRSPVPARPTISVEKVALFCSPASGARSQALQLSCIDGQITAVAKAKVYTSILRPGERRGKAAKRLASQYLSCRASLQKNQRKTI